MRIWFKIPKINVLKSIGLGNRDSKNVGTNTAGHCSTSLFAFPLQVSVRAREQVSSLSSGDDRRQIAFISVVRKLEKLLSAYLVSSSKGAQTAKHPRRFGYIRASGCRPFLTKRKNVARKVENGTMSGSTRFSK